MVLMTNWQPNSTEILREVVCPQNKRLLARVSFSVKVGKFFAFILFESGVFLCSVREYPWQKCTALFSMDIETQTGKPSRMIHAEFEF